MNKEPASFTLNVRVWAFIKSKSPEVQFASLEVTPTAIGLSSSDFPRESNLWQNGA